MEAMSRGAWQAWPRRTRSGRAARRRVRFACAIAASLLAVVPGGSPPATAESAPLFLTSAEQGPWIAADKELHFAGSLAIAASLRVEGRSRREALAGAFCLGVLKETYDATLKPRRLKRGASVKDLAADLAGALAGILVLGALDR
jgi:uncharacterized protein YfiM (DUF2279 family)